MVIKVLGSAAGGGFPPWNCNGRNSADVRQGKGGLAPRSQASVAVSADGRRAAQLVEQRRARDSRRLRLDAGRVLGDLAERRDRDRVAGVVLAAVAGGQLPHPSGELGRHVDDLFAVGDELLSEDSADPGGAFDRPTPLRPPLGEAAQGPVALGAGWEPLLGEELATLVNGDGGVAVLVEVNPDQDVHGPPSGRDG